MRVPIGFNKSVLLRASAVLCPQLLRRLFKTPDVDENE